MKCILAEKPSVAKNIADALGIKQKQDGYFEGHGYVITWAFGHLLELYDAKDYDAAMARWKFDNFPFIPDQFKYKIKSGRGSGPDSGARKQLGIIKRLMHRPDVEAVISACDYDREGQLIGDSIIDYIRPHKPVYRLLLNEWTEKEVVHGLKHLKQNKELKPLYDSGISRQWADWVIGINLTSVTTLKYQTGRGAVLNVGRVLLPTLKVIYDRDKEMEQFKPEAYFKLRGEFITGAGDRFEATYKEVRQDRFSDKAVLVDVQEKLQEQYADAGSIEKQEKKEFCPPLFNLSGLQGYITNRYKGWTSDKVLKTAQSLYEKKYITYPRTSSIALESSLVSKAAGVLKSVSEDLPYKDEIVFRKTKKVFNDSKVSGHSAIIPTYMKPKRLTPDQQKVYDAIKNRFVMQFMPVSVYEETMINVVFPEASVKGSFLAKGKVQKIAGWKKVEQVNSKDKLLPPVQHQERLETASLKITDHMTEPPKPHTEKTLLRVMETCGKTAKEDDVTDVLSGFSIGTPATRAETIKKLKDIGYIQQAGKDLRCADTGRKLVETFPVKALFDLEYTGRLEKSLEDISKNELQKESFLQTIFHFTKDAVAAIKEDDASAIRTAEKKKTSYEVMGICPSCSEKVVEGYKGFGCVKYGKSCSFIIWKHDKFLASMRKKPTKTMVKALLKDGQAHVKGLTSKRGKKFSAILSYKKNKENDYYSWEMEFDNKKSGKQSS